MSAPARVATLLAVLSHPANVLSGDLGPASWRPDTLDLSMPVLQEPSVQQYYGFLRNYTAVPLKAFDIDSAPKVLRVRNLDDATFQQYVRDGQPFVVEDCMKGFDEDAISNLECKDFAKRWPSGNMRAEYTPGQYHIYLKDPTWYSKIEPTRQHDEHMAKDAKIAGPYIWHVKDEEPLKTKRSVQRHWRTPYFLQPSLANRIEANESFEFWFSMAGGGTFSHADAYCESTISMQFRGRKRWRIQAFPEIRHFLNATGFNDEQIYNGKAHVPWTPETEFTVGAGECFVFPTGYLHETYVDPAGNDADCYTASTFQFNHPRQVNLYRAYLSRFSMSHYGTGEPCVENMRHYATLLTKVDTRSTPSKEESKRVAASILGKYDKNGDGVLQVEDLHKHFKKDAKATRRVLQEGNFRYPWFRSLSQQQQQEFSAEVIAVWSEDAIQYHDLNRDSAVSLEELAKTLLQWHVVQHRLARVRAVLQRPEATEELTLQKLIASEVEVLEKFFCEEGASCPAAEELRQFSVELKSRKKLAARILRRVFGLFEQDHDPEEKLLMHDRSTGESERKTVSRIKSEL